MKLYDGAWVEWTANPMNPVFVPETTQIPLEASDGS
jgi:thiosulfate/3-mercaptopyruvate sulfurtransferase